MKAYPPGADLAAIDVARFVHAGGIDTAAAVGDNIGDSLHVAEGVDVTGRGERLVVRSDVSPRPPGPPPSLTIAARQPLAAQR